MTIHTVNYALRCLTAAALAGGCAGAQPLKWPPAARLLVLVGLLLVGHSGQAQRLVGIRLAKQPVRLDQRDNPSTFTHLLDSVLPRGRTPRAIKRGIVKEFVFEDFTTSRDRVPVLVGQNQRGDQVGIVVDANRNRDFRDDPLLWFKNDSSEGVKPRQHSRVLVTSSRGLIPFILTPTPYHGPGHYNQRLEQKYYLMMNLGERLAGCLPGNSLADSIEVINERVSPVYRNADKHVFLLLPGSTQPARRYYLGDVFTLHDSAFVATRVTPFGDSLYLRPLTAYNRRFYGVAEGSLLPTQALHDLAGQPVALPGPRQRVLLDFWGTWCGPCRELTPMLQALHQAHPEALRMVSIARDEKPLVAHYLQDHSMPWEQVVIPPAEAANSIIGQLRVEAYPTFILLEDGLIVCRGTGEPGLLAVKQYLADHPLAGR